MNDSNLLCLTKGEINNYFIFYLSFYNFFVMNFMCPVQRGIKKIASGH